MWAVTDPGPTFSDHPTLPVSLPFPSDLVCRILWRSFPEGSLGSPRMITGENIGELDMVKDPSYAGLSDIESGALEHVACSLKADSRGDMGKSIRSGLLIVEASTRY